jgi:ubiquinone/menaquinone biosynthesis C-methylase UbiE/Zn finger protein HypA/HybF involved in hydrogenase expression
LAYRHRFTEFTDALTPIYNRLLEVLGGRKYEAFRRRMFELAALEGDECLLDAGCGTGMVAMGIAARYPGCTVHGIDLSPKMIAAARRDAEEHGLAVDFCVGSITDLPHPDASLDVVITSIMYHHLDLAEKRQAVAEIARVLKPGGRYVSSEFGPRAANALQRRLAKGEYTLYPLHLAEAGLILTHEELGVFALWKKVFHRVAVKQAPAQRDGGERVIPERERARALLDQALAEARSHGGGIAALHFVVYGTDQGTETRLREMLQELSLNTPAEGARVVVRVGPNKFLCWNCCGLRFEDYEKESDCPNCGHAASLIPIDVPFALDRVEMLQDEERKDESTGS